MNSQVLPIVTRRAGRLVINRNILPAKCNKQEVINSMYKYILDKYSYTYGQYKISDVNKDLNDLLKREGLL